MATLVVCQAHYAPTKRETLGDEVAVILSSKERFRGLGVNRFRTRLNWDIVTTKQGLSTLKTYNVRFPTLSFPSHWTRKIKTILNRENIPFILRPHHSLLKRVEKLLCPSFCLVRPDRRLLLGPGLNWEHWFSKHFLFRYEHLREQNWLWVIFLSYS